jgi:hypothetical protein
MATIAIANVLSGIGFNLLNWVCGSTHCISFPHFWHITVYAVYNDERIGKQSLPNSFNDKYYR